MFLPITGHSYNYREGTKLAKGHLYALMRHLALYIRALLATTEPGNCPCESLVCPWWGTVVKRRHNMGKGAPPCLNGAFSPSHWCLYRNGQTRKLVPMTHYFCPYNGARFLWIHKVGKFLKEGAHSYLNMCISCRIWRPFIFIKSNNYS